jgi:hypothetical protein
MLALQAPSRNLFSRRTVREPVPTGIVDYLDAIRGVRPHERDDGTRSPQAHAAAEIAGTLLTAKLTPRLLALTGTQQLRPTDPPDRVVSRYIADVATLDDHVDAVNRLFNSIALNQIRMPIDTDWSLLSAPGGDDWESRRALTEAGLRRRAQREQEDRDRARLAGGLFTATAPGALLGPHVVTAELLAGRRDTVLARCMNDVDRRCRKVSYYAATCLLNGVIDGLLGAVSWHAEDVCWYARNEHHLRSKAARRGQSAYEHWRVCKEVHLMDAMHLDGIPGWLELPREVQAVVDAIPPFLHPEIGTVVGTMVREREISWLAGEVTYPAERVVPRRRLVFDPAIVVGSIVLTGWELPEHYVPGWWQRLDCALAR